MGTPSSPLPVLIGALALDATLGEPPLWAHPVVAIGWVGDQVETIILRPDEALPFPLMRGALGWASGLVVCTTAGILIARLPRPIQALALWTLFSHKMLVDEVQAVEDELDTSLEAGRTRVSWLVSRDTSTLDASQVRGAAIESLAENLSDSVTAPLFFWALGSMPAVAAYRWMNTADARFGYRTPRWEKLGKVAARMDDVANLIPARITGLCLAQSKQVLANALPEVHTTPSPNAGWPMAVMAHYLGTRLEKVGVYALNPKGRLPKPGDIPKAIAQVNRAHIAIGVLTGALALAKWRLWR